MATIQHLPFGFTKSVLSSPTSSISCQSMGRTLFHPALDLHSLEQHANLNNTTHSLSSSKQAQFVLQQLRDTVTACKAFTHELTEVCNSGVRVSQCLASSFKEMTMLSNENNHNPTVECCMPQDVIKQFSDNWNQLAVVTQNAIASLDQTPFSVLQDSLAKLEMNHQNSQFDGTSPSDESNKILLASFLAIVHLQYQFSLSVCESFVDLLKVNPDELGLHHDVRENGAKTSVDINKETINSIQKHFSSFINGLQSKHCEDTVDSRNFNHVNNGTKSETSNSRNNKRTYRGWPRSSSLDSGTANIENESKTWSLKCLPPLLGLNSDPLMGQNTSALWQENSSLESLWSFSAQSYDLANSTNKCGNGGLASNNELQAVVSLLSYQTADRTSSTAASYSAISSDANASVWTPEDKTVTVTRQRSILKKSEKATHDLKPLGTWPRTGSNLSSCIWGIYSETQETSLPESDAILTLHPEIPIQRDLNNGYPQYSTRGMSLLSNGHRHSHMRATKSTSWPVVDCPPESHPSDSNSSSDHGEGSSGQVDEANGAFFMGLDLVGNDLMASVRQRRHSSGSMLPDVSGNTSCSSIRTKSIDSITVEEKSRLSIWQSNIANSSQNGKIEECAPVVGYENVLWSSQLPQGLPPSGADNRTKPKVERKYSLFGHAAC